VIRAYLSFRWGGQASQGFIDRIARRVRYDGRPAVLLYAGDHDPAGWGILQNFVDRTQCWANPELPEWDPDVMPRNRGQRRDRAHGGMRDMPNLDRYRKYRIALVPEQCDEHDLPRNAAKEKDPNIAMFLATFADTLTPDEVDDGLGVQVEVDALEPPVLRQLFTDAIDQYWDAEAYDAVIEVEQDDIDLLDGIIEGME
jgi:hypothetical protein